MKNCHENFHQKSSTGFYFSSLVIKIKIQQPFFPADFIFPASLSKIHTLYKIRSRIKRMRDSPNLASKLEKFLLSSRLSNSPFTARAPSHVPSARLYGRRYQSFDERKYLRTKYSNQMPSHISKIVSLSVCWLVCPFHCQSVTCRGL